MDGIRGNKKPAKVTVREIKSEMLWIGNAGDLRDIRATLSAGVRAIVDLAANEAAVVYPREIPYCRLPLCEGVDNPTEILRLAVETTVGFLGAQLPTLVACSAGMSRSPAIVAAALARMENRPPEEVLARIMAAGPRDVDPALWRDIKRQLFPATGRAEQAPSSTSIALLVLKTKQIEKLIGFYRTLDLVFVEEQHGKGPVHFSTRVGEATFEIYPAADAEIVNASTRLGFQVRSLAAKIETLRALGTPIVSEPKSSPWGERAVVRDPDGRAVELYGSHR